MKSEILNDNPLAGVLRDLSSINEIRNHEIYCPIAKVRGLMSPLHASDDMKLKTMIVSIDLYDQELSALLYNHCRFPELESQNITVSWKDFLEGMSYLDRQVMLWGLFAATYKTLDPQTISCPYCSNEITDTIHANDLLQDDSLVQWEHSDPFTEYTFPIEYVIESETSAIDKVVFHTQLSNISRHIELLGIIPSEKLRQNYEKSNSLFSSTEELTSVTTKFEIVYKDPEKESFVTDNLRQIHMLIQTQVTLDVSEDVLEKFDDHFNKYVPRFYKKYECSTCKRDFTYNVNLELSFFRRFLRGRYNM